MLEVKTVELRIVAAKSAKISVIDAVQEVSDSAGLLKKRLDAVTLVAAMTCLTAAV